MKVRIYSFVLKSLIPALVGRGFATRTGCFVDLRESPDYLGLEQH